MDVGIRSFSLVEWCFLISVFSTATTLERGHFELKNIKAIFVGYCMKKSIENPHFDAQFLERVQNPQTKKKAFAELVAAFSQPLYWQIRRMVLNHDIANEIVQETFLKAWRAIDSFRADAKIYTWLYRIAINESLNYIDKQKRLREHTIEIDDDNRYLVENVMGDPYFDGDAAELLFQNAINTLPPKQKQVFLLRYYDELPYADIAELTGVSEGSLKASYHHAVAKVKKYIEEHH